MNEIYQKRISNLRDILSLKSCEAYLNFTKEDVYYLTGFNSTNSNLIVTNHLVRIFTDKRYIQQIKNSEKFIEFEIINNNLIESLKNFVLKEKIKSLIVQPEKISLKLYQILKKIIGVNVISFEKGFNHLFAIQDDYSIENSKKALSITEKIFNDILSYIKEGITEKDLQTELRYRINKLADDESFSPIVLFGENTAFPHGVPSNCKLKKNSPVLIDFGVKINGYNSDFTRMIYYGEVTDEFYKYYNIVRGALNFAFEKIELNKPAKEIAQFVIDYFKKYNVQNHFTHGLGHGLGVYVHNFPKISAQSNDVILDNLLLAIEPALYFENKFGIRIEQSVLLYEGKKQILNTISDELIII